MRTLFVRWAQDPKLVLALLGLSLFGIAMIYSAGVLNVPSPVTQGAWLRQGVWLVLALIAFTTVSRIPLRWFEWAAYPAFVMAVVVLGATLVIGTGGGTAAGVKSWISLGGFRFQPAEVAKVATILALARLLSSQDGPPGSLRELLAPAALVAVPLGLVILQPDLGTALAFVGILFSVLYWAGTPLPMLLLLASPGLGLILTFDTRVWSAYTILLVIALYLYRYRL